MKLIENLKMPLNYSENELFKEIFKKTNLKKDDIKSYILVKESIDARRKPTVFKIVNVAVETDVPKTNLKDVFIDKKGLEYHKLSRKIKRPIVVGFGPAGMFCGLTLALMGFCPIVIEQGKNVDERKIDVENFWQNRVLNKHSNIQFGEGGAGTFSDGKLNSNINNEYCKKVINEFILNGAPKEIFYNSKPHIGSDKLPEIVKNIRQKIITNGGEIRFNTKLIDISMQNNKISSIKTRNILKNEEQILETECLVLAVGHSAIETFELLKKKEFSLKQKSFAMGVRIEQTQEQINLMQYGKISKDLPSADYKLVEHLPSGRSVFTFCMCPGGQVVASSSEEGTIVTNGMSEFARDGKNANSALLVNVTPGDYQSDDVLAGLYFQRKFERLAFELGGKKYNAPAQSVGGFLKNKIDNKSILSTYRPSLTLTDISKCLPSFVSESLKEAIPKINSRMKNFAKDENLLIAIESRSSCPLTILRDENYESSIKGIFPIGEGAGYAGGIMSSAQDGIKCAEKIEKLFN